MMVDTRRVFGRCEFLTKEQTLSFFLSLSEGGERQMLIYRLFYWSALVWENSVFWEFLKTRSNHYL